MMIRPNDGGGTTLILAEGDNLDDVPESHRGVVSDPVRHAFRDPHAYFSGVASRTTIPNLQKYLSDFVAHGRWCLLLADTYMMDRSTIAGFQWVHPGQHACLFGPATKPCSDTRFSPLYNDFDFVHWDAIGFAGGIFPCHELIPRLHEWGTTHESCVSRRLNDPLRQYCLRRHDDLQFCGRRGFLVAREWSVLCCWHVFRNVRRDLRSTPRKPIA
ncbi:hypothetical protein UC8_01480 [Roseimaritima ulvae]|uniref:Uncharacterized protein n=1 Tax=Roseimaritima ulvae TaxID=980254 RepID=A0A5B9QL08_9BACT|nr:hypothetical protein UC8_01480 [Roseimaritima ulvae]